MPRVKIAAIIEEMDAAGWIFNEDQFDKCLSRSTTAKPAR